MISFNDVYGDSVLMIQKLSVLRIFTKNEVVYKISQF